MACCSGSTFTPAPDAALDPSQRVNFTTGMVLGVDDFRQEHAYLAARDECALRATDGYGVIGGLGVTVPVKDQGDTTVEVRVAPGLASLPDGKLVAITAEQCARLDAWLTGPGKPPADRSGTAAVYVVLRHLEVSGTPVPIPGEPCRDESTLQADARITDSFTLDFSWTPPVSTEDDGLRTFAAWLRLVQVRDAPSPEIPIPDFQNAVETGVQLAIETAWHTVNPPLAAPPEIHSKPELAIPRARYAEYINAAFEVWVRKLRTIYVAKHGPVPPAETTAETGLLLAAIDFDLDAGNLVYPADGQPAVVRWLGRPQLLHLRMLQEWLFTNVENDAPREAHYVLGKGDDRLPNAQNLRGDFSDREYALARVDFVPDPTGDEGATKAVLRPAVKWPGGGEGAGGPDYYGPEMKEPIPVNDGGTGQGDSPELGQLPVGTPAGEYDPARFRLGRLSGAGHNVSDSDERVSNIAVDVASAAPDILLDTVQDIDPAASPTFAGLTLSDPTSAVLGTDDQGAVIAATRWDGDEAKVGGGNVYYAPGQSGTVRIEDGGTGQREAPEPGQLLVGSPADDAAHFRLGRLSGSEHTVPGSDKRVSNIAVDVTSAAPDVLLDTVQDIDPAARPTFAGLTVNGLVSVDGLTLSDPTSAVLGTDDQGGVIAATPWDGNEGQLGKGVAYYYAPGQTGAVRIEDGGTGLKQRPGQLQVLVGDKDGGEGSFVLATLVGEGIDVQLVPPDRRVGGTPWEIKFTGSAGIALPLAVGQGGTGQGTHPKDGQLLIGDSRDAFSVGDLRPRVKDRHIGVEFDESTKDLIVDTTPQTHWAVRIVEGETKLESSDHVLVFAGRESGGLELGDLSEDENGRVIVVKNNGLGSVKVSRAGDATDDRPFIDGRSTLSLERLGYTTLIFVAKFNGWAVIARG